MSRQNTTRTKSRSRTPRKTVEITPRHEVYAHIKMLIESSQINELEAYLKKHPLIWGDYVRMEVGRPRRTIEPQFTNVITGQESLGPNDVHISTNPLHVAVYSNDSDALRVLLESGCPVHYEYEKDSNLFVSPIVIAIQNQSYTIIEQLLQAGVDLTYEKSPIASYDTLYPHGWPLLEAIKIQDERIIEMLLASSQHNHMNTSTNTNEQLLFKAKMTHSPLFVGFTSGGLDFVKVLVEKYAFPIEQTSIQGLNCIMEICQDWIDAPLQALFNETHYMDTTSQLWLHMKHQTISYLIRSLQNSPNYSRLFDAFTVHSIVKGPLRLNSRADPSLSIMRIDSGKLDCFTPTPSSTWKTSAAHLLMFSMLPHLQSAIDTFVTETTRVALIPYEIAQTQLKTIVNTMLPYHAMLFAILARRYDIFFHLLANTSPNAIPNLINAFSLALIAKTGWARALKILFSSLDREYLISIAFTEVSSADAYGPSTSTSSANTANAMSAESSASFSKSNTTPSTNITHRIHFLDLSFPTTTQTTWKLLHETCIKYKFLPKDIQPDYALTPVPVQYLYGHTSHVPDYRSTQPQTANSAVLDGLTDARAVSYSDHGNVIIRSDPLNYLPPFLVTPEVRVKAGQGFEFVTQVHEYLLAELKKFKDPVPSSSSSTPTSTPNTSSRRLSIDTSTARRHSVHSTTSGGMSSSSTPPVLTRQETVTNVNFFLQHQHQQQLQHLEHESAEQACHHRFKSVALDIFFYALSVGDWHTVMLYLRDCALTSNNGEIFMIHPSIFDPIAFLPKLPVIYRECIDVSSLSTFFGLLFCDHLNSVPVWFSKIVQTDILYYLLIGESNDDFDGLIPSLSHLPPQGGNVSMFTSGNTNKSTAQNNSGGVATHAANPVTYIPAVNYEPVVPTNIYNAAGSMTPSLESNSAPSDEHPPLSLDDTTSGGVAPTVTGGSSLHPPHDDSSSPHNSPIQLSRRGSFFSRNKRIGARFNPTLIFGPQHQSYHYLDRWFKYTPHSSLLRYIVKLTALLHEPSIYPRSQCLSSSYKLTQYYIDSLRQSFIISHLLATTNSDLLYRTMAVLAQQFHMMRQQHAHNYPPAAAVGDSSSLDNHALSSPLSINAMTNTPYLYQFLASLVPLQIQQSLLMHQLGSNYYPFIKTIQGYANPVYIYPSHGQTYALSTRTAGVLNRVQKILSHFEHLHHTTYDDEDESPDDSRGGLAQLAQRSFDLPLHQLLIAFKDVNGNTSGQMGELSYENASTLNGLLIKNAPAKAISLGDDAVVVIDDVVDDDDKNSAPEVATNDNNSSVFEVEPVVIGESAHDNSDDVGVTVENTVETDVDADVQADADVETDADVDVDVGTKTDVEADVETVHANIDVEAGVDVEAEVEADADVDVKTDVDPDVEAQVDVEADVEAVDANSDADPDVEAQVDVDNATGDADTKTDVEPDDDVEAEVDVDVEADCDVEAKVDVETGADVEAEVNTDTDVEAQVDVDDDVKAEVDADVEATQTDQDDSNPTIAAAISAIDGNQLPGSDDEESDHDDKANANEDTSDPCPTNASEKDELDTAEAPSRNSAPIDILTSTVSNDDVTSDAVANDSAAASTAIQTSTSSPQVGTTTATPSTSNTNTTITNAKARRQSAAAVSVIGSSSRVSMLIDENMDEPFFNHLHKSKRASPHNGDDHSPKSSMSKRSYSSLFPRLDHSKYQHSTISLDDDAAPAIDLPSPTSSSSQHVTSTLASASSSFVSTLMGSVQSRLSDDESTQKLHDQLLSSYRTTNKNVVDSIYAHIAPLTSTLLPRPFTTKQLTQFPQLSLAHGIALFYRIKSPYREQKRGYNALYRSKYPDMHRSITLLDMAFRHQISVQYHGMFKRNISVEGVHNTLKQLDISTTEKHSEYFTKIYYKYLYRHTSSSILAHEQTQQELRQLEKDIKAGKLQALNTGDNDQKSVAVTSADQKKYIKSLLESHHKVSRELDEARKLIKKLYEKSYNQNIDVLDDDNFNEEQLRLLHKHDKKTETTFFRKFSTSIMGNSNKKNTGITADSVSTAGAISRRGTVSNTLSSRPSSAASDGSAAGTANDQDPMTSLRRASQQGHFRSSLALTPVGSNLGQASDHGSIASSDPSTALVPPYASLSTTPIRHIPQKVIQPLTLMDSHDFPLDVAGNQPEPHTLRVVRILNMLLLNLRDYLAGPKFTPATSNVDRPTDITNRYSLLPVHFSHVVLSLLLQMQDVQLASLIYKTITNTCSVKLECTKEKLPILSLDDCQYLSSYHQVDATTSQAKDVNTAYTDALQCSTDDLKAVTYGDINTLIYERSNIPLLNRIAAYHVYSHHEANNSAMESVGVQPCPPVLKVFDQCQQRIKGSSTTTNASPSRLPMGVCAGLTLTNVIGNTPLTSLPLHAIGHIASNPDLLYLLLDSGLDIHYTNDQGVSFLTLCIQYYATIRSTIGGNARQLQDQVKGLICNLVIDRHISLFTTNYALHSGTATPTPLHWLLFYKCVDIIEYITMINPTVLTSPHIKEGYAPETVNVSIITPYSGYSSQYHHSLKTTAGGLSSSSSASKMKKFISPLLLPVTIQDAKKWLASTPIVYPTLETVVDDILAWGYLMVYNQVNSDAVLLSAIRRSEAISSLNRSDSTLLPISLPTAHPTKAASTPINTSATTTITPPTVTEGTNSEDGENNLPLSTTAQRVMNTLEYYQAKMDVYSNVVSKWAQQNAFMPRMASIIGDHTNSNANHDIAGVRFTYVPLSWNWSVFSKTYLSHCHDQVLLKPFTASLQKAIQHTTTYYNVCYFSPEYFDMTVWTRWFKFTKDLALKKLEQEKLLETSSPVNTSADPAELSN